MDHYFADNEKELEATTTFTEIFIESVDFWHSNIIQLFSYFIRNYSDDMNKSIDNCVLDGKIQVDHHELCPFFNVH